MNNLIQRIMLEEYRSHLETLLSEIKVFDKKEKTILSPDLKVKHEKSGFVYTVGGIKGKKGSAIVALRPPDEPRPTAVSDEEYEIDDNLLHYVREKQFEKDYEVA
jgi:hypothetical protein